MPAPKSKARSKPRPVSSQPEEISGSVETITFRNDATGYTVCSVRIHGAAAEAGPSVVVGTCAAIWVGEELRATGRWVCHQQHGLQFQADSITCIAPTSAEGIVRYLASGMIRGIGKVNAKRIVEHFGDRTLEVIDRESQRLEEVEGIGPTRRKLIKDSWNAQRGTREIMIFLQAHGVGTAMSARIYRRYGQDAIALIKQNPYRLCRDIAGIGFKTADAIAMSIGVPRDSPDRARAGLLYALTAQQEEGHCFCEEPELILAAQDLLGIPAETLAEALRRELSEARTLVFASGRVYLASLYHAERRVAAKLLRMQETPAAFRAIDPAKALAWVAPRLGIELAAQQSAAIAEALASKVSVITGGPGVGKTTIVRALVAIYGARRLRVVLGAPTGRASRRMGEATGQEARTLHRILRYNPQRRAFEHNRDRPVECDVVILDEASMIDIVLADQFLDALPDAATLVLVGDTDQLPSVGPGNVLRDVIASGAVPCTRLDVIFRQKTGGLIVRNAHRINDGAFVETAPPGVRTDFYFLPGDNPDQMLRRIVELVSVRIPRTFGFDPLADVQVLTPMRKNQLGADNLNLVLQQVLNPRGPSVQRFGRTYRVGDRVMQIRNDYDKDVFNGDIGFLEAIDAEDQSVCVNYDGRSVPYEFSELDEIVHAYACSIHKSQGSEYPAVIVVLATQHFKLLQRNLLYTAVTRGRKLVCLVASRKAVEIALRNNEIQLRRTTLAEYLSGRGASPSGADPAADPALPAAPHSATLPASPGSPPP